MVPGIDCACAPADDRCKVQIAPVDYSPRAGQALTARRQVQIPVERSLHLRGRPAIGRPHLLASALAALLVVLGPGTALAETSDASATPQEPRVQRPGDVAGYRLPFEPGLDVYIHQAWANAYSHNGRAAYAYDFGLQLDTPVLAAASGVVSYVHGGETACGGAELKLHANYVTIDHPDGSSTQYGHLGAVEVAVGDVVEVGQEIARSGRTGYTGCMPHLHFARQLQGGPVTQSIPVYFEEFPDAGLRDGATIRSTPACATAGAEDSPTGRLCATYRGAGADAPVLFSRLEAAIDYDWAKQSPGGYWLDNSTDGFAASWTGSFEIDEPGVYAFRVRATDRVRVRIDGVTLVDAWTDFARPRTLSLPWRATSGTHTIEVEHLDASGRGRLQVTWRPQLIDGAWVRWSKARPEA